MITRLPRRLWMRFTTPLRLAWIARSADAFLASYPKSGRTWFRFILANYFYAVMLETGVDLHTMFSVLPNFDLDPVRGVPAFGRAGGAEIPMIPVTHLSYSALLFQRRPVVFMVRDPRDVMVSAYFHATRQKRRYEGDLSNFITDPRQGVPALTNYLNGWAHGLSKHRHFVLSYEQLSAQPEQTTEDVLTFLGCNVRADAVHQAVARSRFEAMRDLEVRQGIPGHDYDRTDGESLRMRRGIVAGFREYLSDRDIDVIEAALKSNLTPAAKRLVDVAGARSA